MQEVVRHLVDEQRRAGLALYAGAIQILPAELGESLHGQFRQHIVIARGRLGAATQRAGHRDDLRQFHGAFNRGMARENLFEQGRTGTRQTDDEDRIGRWVAAARAFGEELARVDLLRFCDPRAGVAGAVGHGLQAQGVAGSVMRKRIGVVRAIFERFAEREIEMEAMLRGKLIGGKIVARELRAHRRDLVVAEAEGLEIGEAPIRLAEAGIERDAAPISSDGLVLTPGGLQRVAVAHPHPRVVRIFAEDRFV